MTFRGKPPSRCPRIATSRPSKVSRDTHHRRPREPQCSGGRSDASPRQRRPRTSRHEFAIRQGSPRCASASHAHLLFRCEQLSPEPRLALPTDRTENVLDAPVQSWWLGLVAGRTGEPHPVSPGVRGTIEDGQLTLTGEVETETELAALAAEADGQRERFRKLDNEVT